MILRNFARFMRYLSATARFYTLLMAWPFILLGIAYAQQASVNGTTPPGNAVGKSAGTYSLNDLENINLYNGNLNFKLPLLTLNGRGEADLDMALAINSKRWRVEREVINIKPEQGPPAVCYVERIIHYDNEGEIIDVQEVPRNCFTGESPGYYDVFEYPVPESEYPYLSNASQLVVVRSITRSAYSPGIIIARGRGIDTRNKSFLTRLTFIASDGSSYELRDQLTGGRVQNSIGFSRGRVFVAADGSGLSFISDTDIIDKRWQDMVAPTGYLLTKSGTRHRVENGFIIWIRDRNGNILNLSYDNFVLNGNSFYGVESITDSLNRRVNIGYVDKTATIDYRGAKGASRTIKIRYAGLDEVLRQNSQYRINSLRELFPGLNYGTGGDELYNPGSMISSVELPDGRLFRFYYNPYGELARVDMPMGGAAEYDYEFESSVGRRIKERRVLTDGTALEQKQSFNAESTGTPINPDTLITTVCAETRDSANSLLESSKHYFYGKPFESAWATAGAYAPWKEGREYKTEILDSNGNVLRRIEHLWRQRAPVPWWNGPNIYFEPPNDPHVAETTTALLDTNQVTKQTFSYDSFMNLVAVVDYDFGNGAPGPLLRSAVTEYLTNNPHQSNVDYANDLDLHIRNLPKETSVFDGEGALVSRTSFEYDRYDLWPLQDAPNIARHDSSFNAGYGYRGNLVKTSHAVLGSPSSSITTYNQYDIAGNVVRAVDGRDNETVFDYSDRFGSPDGAARSNAAPTELDGLFSYAFPTKITNLLEHEAYTQYDYHLGRPVDVEDANGVISSSHYNDPLDRPTQIISAVNVPANKRQTTFSYNDAAKIVATTSDLSVYGDNKLRSEIINDGLGRAIESRSYENETDYIRSYTNYDAIGRPHKTSNPHRPGGAITWTMTSYDSLGRIIDVTTPDEAVIHTDYSGNRVTVTDQAGKRRRSETDALGRLVKVTEDPDGLNYNTHYSYDALGNLLQVTQGSQTRTFAYDSLSRLISATNPESGTMTYAYDPNGNLIEKTDARGVKTTMTYDALNRVILKAYSGITPEGTAAANATPLVNYFYDDYSVLPSGAPRWPGTPSKGRLIGVKYGTGSDGTYYKYDAAGRIVTSNQRQGTANYATIYEYNLAGGVTVESRGSSKGDALGSRRRYLTMTYDEAGRLAVLGTNAYPFTGGNNLVRDISYTPFGALQSEKYGNGLIHSIGYNNRLQPTEIRLGRPDNLESIFTIYSIYGTAKNVNDQDAEITAAHNNGNIARIKYSVSGTIQYTQTFQYDPLNRLRYGVEHNNAVYNDGARAWYQTFDFDRYGNRGINVVNTSDNVDAMNSALQLADFSQANNRITRSGFVYDTAGNLTAEPGKSYTYNAENRMITATVAVGGMSQYFYDGNGRRVKKIVGGVATRFEYGAGGELITERNESNGAVIKDYFYKGGELLATSKIGNAYEYEYATADHLGSPRAWTDGSGNLVAGGRHDYLPFGEELFEGYGVRTTAQGYAASTQADGQRKQFGSKERDKETGLDYFLARYYSSIQGRFTSPDEFQGDPREVFILGSGAPTKQALPYADITNPQSLNKYTYSYNNPLRYTDPDGHIPVETAIDVVSFAASFYAMVTNPSWVNLGYLAWDGLATLIPYVPGSWVAKVGKYGYRGLEAAGIIGKPLDAFETAVNNQFIKEGVGLLGQGDDSTRKVLGLADNVKTADFLGVTKGGTFIIADTKGIGDIGSGIGQLQNTATALINKVSGSVDFSAELVLRKGSEKALQNGYGEFKAFGNHLHKWNAKANNGNGAWELVKVGSGNNTKPVTVRYVEGPR